MTEEIWLPTTEFPCHYEVSNLGRVRSLPRLGTGKRKSYGGNILKPNLTTWGYHQVPLSVDGVRHMRRVHTLVLQAFVGPSGGLVCNHKDACRTNNRLENLEWVTQYQNVRHAIDVMGNNGGPKRRLTDQQISDAILLRSQGWTIRAVAELFGVPYRCVQKPTTGCGYENMPRGERNPSAKLTEANVIAIRRMKAEGHSVAVIAMAVGVGKSTVKKVLRRETWKHVTEVAKS